MRLIDADALLEQIDAAFFKTDPTGEEQLGFLHCRRIAREMQTIDPAEYFANVDRIKQCPNCRYQMLGEEKCGWISVKDILPDKHTTVLVYRPTMATKYMASYFGNGVFCEGAFDIKGNEVITHWMPLPEPPKEV